MRPGLGEIAVRVVAETIDGGEFRCTRDTDAGN
ncbi:Uncharacterised protein [Nocardia brasiliensis]|nr:Uncharacterised protein [Nocardia brasiliensis]